MWGGGRGRCRCRCVCSLLGYGDSRGGSRAHLMDCLAGAFPKNSFIEAWRAPQFFCTTACIGGRRWAALLGREGEGTWGGAGGCRGGRDGLMMVWKGGRGRCWGQLWLTWVAWSTRAFMGLGFRGDAVREKGLAGDGGGAFLSQPANGTSGVGYASGGGTLWKPIHSVEGGSAAVVGLGGA